MHNDVIGPSAGTMPASEVGWRGIAVPARPTHLCGSMGAVMCNSWMGRRCAAARWLISGLVLAGMFGWVRPAIAGFSVERETVWADRTRHQAHFELQFNRPPDFAAIGSTGHPRD